MRVPSPALESAGRTNPQQALFSRYFHVLKVERNWRAIPESTSFFQILDRVINAELERRQEPWLPTAWAPPCEWCARKGFLTPQIWKSKVSIS